MLAVLARTVCNEAYVQVIVNVFNSLDVIPEFLHQSDADSDAGRRSLLWQVVQSSGVMAVSQAHNPTPASHLPLCTPEFAWSLPNISVLQPV